MKPEDDKNLFNLLSKNKIFRELTPSKKKVLFRYIDDLSKYGKGCNKSDLMRITEITNKFNAKNCQGLLAKLIVIIIENIPYEIREESEILTGVE